MAQYRVPNPYDPRYALPANVLAENPGRGALVTHQLPRGTFSAPPRCWTGCGFALPDYVLSEGAGRGAAYTWQLPRGTVPVLVPPALGDDAPSAAQDDPIRDYGRVFADHVLTTITGVPPEMRRPALRALLAELEPGLPGRVERRARTYRGSGMSPDDALRAALASATSEGLARELVALGRGEAPRKTSQLGLAYYGEEASALALAGIWGSIKGAAKKVGGAVKTAAEKVGSAAKTAGEKAYGWAKDAVDFAGDLACKVVGSSATQVAAGAASVAYGAPPQAGQAGAQAAASLCRKKERPVLTMFAQVKPTGPPKWVIPAALAGAGVVAYLALRK